MKLPVDPRLPIQGGPDYDRSLYQRLYALFRSIAQGVNAVADATDANASAIATNTDDIAANTGAIAGKANTTQEDWIAATLVNSWVNYGAPFALAAYYKDTLDVVHLRGVVKAGSANSAILTLPIGYRPAHDMVFSAIDGTGTGIRMDVRAVDGVVGSLYGPVNNSYFSLDTVTFRV